MVLANRTRVQNSRTLLRAFGGLNEGYGCSEAEYSAGINFSSRDFPALSTRKPRRKLRTLTGLNGMYHLNGLLTVCGKDLVYTPDDGGETVTCTDAVADSKKALVGLGTKILIFPDKVAFDTADGSVTALGALWTAADKSVTFAPCDAAGKTYQVEAFGRDEPADPADGQLFLRVEDADHPWRYDSTLEMYSKNSGSWADIPLEYCRITAAGLGKLFRQWDTVTVQGTAAQQAGKFELPCSVVDMTEKEQLQTMMVENMQRSDLTVYEQAQGFQMMLDMGDTVERVADRSGFSQSTIRRRIKLLELNHDNFKKAEQRGATLSDFVELNKIEDLDARNRVLETLGTANFNREMQNALSDQKYQHRKAEWIEQLRQFAVENPDANYSTHTHVAGYGYWNTSKDVEVPDDADSVAYCYKVSQNQIDLYKERDLEKENAETAKREEKRQQEQFYKDQLAALTNYMFELRRDFVTQLSTAECKKHLGEIVRFAVDAFDSNYDGELTIKLLGVAPPETDGVDLLDYLESTSVFSDQPEKALLSLAYSAADDGSNGYWGWVWKPDYQSGGYGWEENGRLDAIYTLLVALGYEMSDEEKALQNGTHAIFSTNAPKKADAPCDRCKAAHPNCDKCCKACDEPCNAVQDCKKNEERTENDE